MANTKVTGDVIANGTISTVHLADNAITAAKLDSAATGITFADLTVDTNTLYVDAANNRVGIGTTSPQRFLHINSSNVQIAALIESTNTTSAQLNFKNGSTTNNGGFIKTTGDNIILTANSTGASHLVVASGGSVGIGTTSPSEKLHVNSGTGNVPALFESTDNLSLITFKDNNTTTDVGIGADDNDEVFYAGGSERMRIDSSGDTTFTGDVTIGNNASIKSIGSIRIDIDEDNDSTGRAFLVRNDGGTNTLFKIEESGDVGIGTTSPQRKLDVGGTALIASAGNVNKGTLALGVQSSGSNKWSVITGAHYNAASGSGNGSGSAGIMMIGTYAQNGENDIIIGGNIYEANAATSIQFWTHTTDTSTAGGTRRMIITSNGNVGMGSTSFSPATGLHLYYQNSADMGSVLTLGNNGCCVANRTGIGFKDGSYYRSGIVFETSGTDGYAGHIIFKKSSNSTTLDGTTETMRIHSNGRVLINSTNYSSDSMCHIGGNSSNYALYLYANSIYSSNYRYQRFFSGGNIAGGIEGTNQTSVSYTTSSDYRMKKNIITLENGLDRVLKLKPVKFDWKLNNETTEGFIAHEAQEIFPYAVTGEKDGEDMQGMDYGRITPLLVKAIQEQQEIINDLKNRIQTLENN